MVHACTTDSCGQTWRETISVMAPGEMSMSCTPVMLGRRRILEHELALLAALKQLESQPLPMCREPRCSGDALVCQAHATEAKYDSLPHPSSRRPVNAMLGVQAQVFEVHQGCLHIEMIRHVRLPYTTREDGLDARR